MTKKLTFPTFTVTLWDDSGEAKKELTVKAAAFSKISEVKELQYKLIEKFERYQGSLGELLGDPVVIADMRSLAGLLKVVGQTEPGFDFENLYDNGDIVQLGKIFFSESVDENMRSPGWEDQTIDGVPYKIYLKPEHRQNPMPSAIARIHDLAFFEELLRVRQLIASEEKQEREKEEAKAIAKLKVAETAA